jgi:hypothetical protein
MPLIFTGRLEMLFLVLTEEGALHHQEMREKALEQASAGNNNKPGLPRQAPKRNMDAEPGPSHKRMA